MSHDGRPMWTKERIEDMRRALTAEYGPERGLTESRKGFGGATAETEIESLRAQLAEKEREWKPIETAPKDNETEIILARGNRVTAGYWMEWKETCSEYHASTGVYLGESIQGGGAMWMSQDGGFTDEEPPTHWMPLPEPPRTGE